MSKSKLNAVIIAWLVVMTAGCAAKRQHLIMSELGRGTMQRIVFLGDSITYDGRYVADFEAWLVQRYPERAVEVINVGLPSETVSGLTEQGHADGKFDRPYLMDRLASVLEKTRPDLVFACYGMNCGIYLPLDDDRFARYRDGITKLHEAVVKTGARIVHVTPPMYDAVNAGGHVAEYNGVLARYSEWLLSKRADDWDVLDLHGPMTAEVERQRAADPGFLFAADGVHPNDAGHWFLARLLIGYCGGDEAAAAGSVDEMLGSTAGIHPLVHQRMALLRDAWLTYTGHNHPMIPKGLGLADTNAQSSALTDRIREMLVAN